MKRPHIVGVDRHRLGVTGGAGLGLVGETGKLLVRVGQLGEAVAQFPSTDDALEALHVAGPITVRPAER